jgi:hypothetical protein
MGVGAMHGTGGTVAVALGVAEVVGAVWGTVEVGEAGHKEVTKGQVVSPPGVAVGPPAPVPRAVTPLDRGG